MPYREPITQSLKGEAEKNRKKWMTVYTSVISFSGLLILINAAFQMKDHFTPGFFLFVVMVSIAELSSVELFFSSRFSTVSVASVITAGSIPLFGPAGSALIMGISGLTTAITTTRVRKTHPGEKQASIFQRTGFNTGMYAISALTAGWMYSLFGGSSPVVALRNFLPFTLAVISLYATNILLLVLVIFLQTGRGPFRIWTENFRWAVPISVLGGLVGGGALAVIYVRMGFVGAMVTFMPVLAMGYSFRIYQRNMRGNINKLEEANTELNDANTGLLETLGAVIDAYDVYTYGHSAQVALYALAISKKLGLSLNDQDRIFRAALIHDIGKIGVGEMIIGKQGRLTDDEQEIMRRHPIIAAEILRKTKGLQVYIPIVRHHHERWDGKGYPAGLAGEEIPLGARVIALADSVEAMSSDRPYRKGLNCASVKSEVARCRGTQFDPAVVDAFFMVLDEMGEDFFTNSAAVIDQALIENGVNHADQSPRYLKKSQMSVDDAPECAAEDAAAGGLEHE